MKRRNVSNLFIGILIGCIISTSFTVYASDSFQTIQVAFNKVNLSVNGQKVVADNILYNGTTYVPIRAVANAFGKNVGWNADTNTASINDAGYIEPTTPTTAFTEAQYQDFASMFKYISEQDTDSGYHVAFYDYVGDLTLEQLYETLNIKNMPYRNEMVKRFYDENKPNGSKPTIQFLGNKFDKFIGGVKFENGKYVIEFPSCDN